MYVREALSVVRSLLGSFLAVAALLLASAAAAGGDASLTPVVDCVVPQGINATTSKVYFGYTNSGIPTSVPFGDSNQIVPGIQFQGQPTVFDTGTYERVFAAAWNPTAFTELAWDFNGLAAIADSTTPVCVAGITGTASDVTLSTATLHGDVDIGGQGTTYHFEYGNGSGDVSTPTRTVVPGPQETVSEPIGDLGPGNPYHFRLVATNGDGTTEGTLATFTTLAPPPPPTTITATTTVTVPAVTTTVTVPAVTTTVTTPGPTTTVTTPGKTTTVTVTAPIKTVTVPGPTTTVTTPGKTTTVTVTVATHRHRPHHRGL